MAEFLSVLFGRRLFGKRAKDLGKDLAEPNDAAKPKRLLKDLAGKTGNKRGRMTVARAQDRLRADWEAIRGQIEMLAASPTIDRTTRIRYARMDRRRYTDLVDVLAKENRLGERAEDFEKAVALRAKYRSGRTRPSRLDLSTMAQLRKALVPVGAGK